MAFSSLSEVLDRKISAAYGRFSRGEISERDCENEISHLRSQRRPLDRRPVHRKGERHRCTREVSLRLATRRSMYCDLPPNIKGKLTVSEGSAMRAILYKCKKTRGKWQCDASVAELADLGSTSATKVQDTTYILRRDGDIEVLYRPHRGRPSDTNVITILSKELVCWLEKSKNGNRGGPRIGFGFASTSNHTDSFFIRAAEESPSKREVRSGSSP